MARKTDRAGQKCGAGEPVFYTASYARLSVESSVSKSDSIKSQQMLICEYMEGRKEFVLVGEYADDGISGTRFERQAFDRMLDGVREGRINCIIVKDLSRFGRDYIEVGNYLEKVFPLLGVRFISLDEEYDSYERGCGDKRLAVILKNLVNEYVAKDVSARVSAVCAAKQERGEYDGGCAPYGYAFADSRKSGFVPDEGPAGIIREIFSWAIQGNPPGKIAGWLTEMGVNPPGVYRRRGELYRKSGEERCWSETTVRYILSNSVYAGHMALHKVSGSKAEGVRRVRLDETQWKITENTHRAIITEENFRKVQEILRMRSMTAALYLRLSKEDEKSDRESGREAESNSIGNQRKLIMSFLERNHEFSGWTVREYVDDGHSGTVFERPGFLRMMKDIKKGEVQCVIVKDFSRFGRDYITLGNYMEHVFPFLQVRFLSVNDGYDSRADGGKTPEIDVPFRNLAYSLYSQDISDKVTASLDVRRRKGIYIGASPPYGYKRGGNGALTPDEKAKDVVQRIYREYLSGKGLAQLARELNEEGILSPKQYKAKSREEGRTSPAASCPEEGKNGIWLPDAVKRILQNELYTGTLCSGAYRSGPLGAGKRLMVPEEERIRVENAHPPIIDGDTFRRVQEKMRRKAAGQAWQFPLKGLVRCGECGRLMVKEKGLFRCRYQRYTAHDRVEGFSAKRMEEIAWRAVEGCLLLSVEKDALLEAEKELWEEKRESLLDRVRKKRRQADRKQEEIRRLYHRYRKEKLGREEYLLQKERAGNLRREAEAELAGLEESCRKLDLKIRESAVKRVFEGKGADTGEDGEKLLKCLLESMYACAGGAIEIRWRFKAIDRISI